VQDSRTLVLRNKSSFYGMIEYISEGLRYVLGTEVRRRASPCSAFEAAGVIVIDSNQAVVLPNLTAAWKAGSAYD